MDIGVRLRAARQKAGLSGRSIDRLAGKPEGSATLIEGRTDANATAATLASYARVLGVSLDWLITGEGPEPTAEGVQAAVERARAARSGATPQRPPPHTRLAEEIAKATAGLDVVAEALDIPLDELHAALSGQPISAAAAATLESYGIAREAWPLRDGEVLPPRVDDDEAA